jgi:DEAD/DEAH box helicase domain-containing protein
MTSEIIVFDVETQNFFTDPEVGWNNFDALRVSVIGAYSYAQDKFFCFEEGETDKAAELFRKARLLVGFSMNRYDVPVLNRYLARVRPPLNLFDKNRLDLLEEIEMVCGRRVSLEKLAQANLGMGKTGDGARAIELYRQGRMEELKSYCLQDVEITRRLFDQYREQGYLLVPGREGEEVRIDFARPARLFRR